MLIKAGVSASQASSQNMLNGSPSTRGATRSQRGTEKHIPKKGTSANTTEHAEGFLITPGAED